MGARSRAARGARLRPGSRLRALLGELRDGRGRRRRRRRRSGSRRGAQRSGFGFGIGIGIDGRPLRRPLREGGAGSARGRTRRGVPRVPRLLPSNGARGFAQGRGGRSLLFFYFRAYAQLPGQLLTSRLFVPRGSDRAALATSLYGSSAFEYAAGFFLSWTVPGPLAAHAAHFTNRFRTFACALLAGESPLDPRVVAAALAVCAGADGSLALGRDARDERTEGGGAQARGKGVAASSSRRRGGAGTETRVGTTSTTSTTRRRSDGRGGVQVAGGFHLGASASRDARDAIGDGRGRRRASRGGGGGRRRGSSRPRLGENRKRPETVVNGRKRSRKRSGAGPHGPS